MTTTTTTTSTTSDGPRSFRVHFRGTLKSVLAHFPVTVLGLVVSSSFARHLVSPPEFPRVFSAIPSESPPRRPCDVEGVHNSLS